MHPFDVVVIGNVGIDTNVYLTGMDIDFSVEANFTENLDYVGQAGGYTSRSFARLGKKSAFIGCVGSDHNGTLVRQVFEADGIDMSGLFLDPAGTSRSVNIMYRDGRRKNFYDGKGHMSLSPDIERCREIMRGAKLVHFSIPNWARLLLPVARELGTVISCDLQDVVALDDPYRRDFIEYADILFCSSVNHTDPAPLVRAFLELGESKIILVGLGEKGCVLGTREGITSFPPVQMAEPVVDTNGAGDCLAAGFLTSFALDGYNLPDAVARGQIAARYVCSLKASSETITRSQLDYLFQEISGV